MILRRIMLGIAGLSVALGAAGCGEKIAPTPMEASVGKDRDISETIIDRINKDVALSDNSRTFQVMTVKGDTTIYGVVNNELERSHAEQIAADTNGVRSVTSRIKLAHQAPPASTQTASAGSPQ
jgi:osmotically-inducible protein OsmY